ncbi:MAG TPA: DUF3606 domain-containing protein [Burkholderiaceae bacterium]|nr:DUF3606 domain-containing protein [Burkholderiaceae bacterium]
MTDELRQRSGQDRSRINVHEGHEVRYWARKFGVSAEMLMDAVQAVGDRADRVEQHLRRKGPVRAEP